MKIKLRLEKLSLFVGLSTYSKLRDNKVNLTTEAQLCKKNIKKAKRTVVIEGVTESMSNF